MPVMMTELRRFGMTGEVLLLIEDCRYGCAGAAEGAADQEVNVGYVPGAIVVGVDTGTTSADAAAAVTHSPVQSG